MACVVPLYKENKYDCASFRGISPLKVVGKVCDDSADKEGHREYRSD